MSITVELDVPAAMRDGTLLRANVFRPGDEGPWPVLLTRTPYGKEAGDMIGWLDPVRAARAGFIVVLQDTRGRFSSDGEWVPFRFEREDGHDSVEWAAQLPGSNGRVGMYGPSYVGNTQWMAAIERPRGLAAFAPSLTWSEPLDGLFARGGALELGLASSWTLQTGIDEVSKRAAEAGADADATVEQMIDEIDGLVSDGYWQLPAAEPAIPRRYGIPDIGAYAMQADPSVPEWCRVAGHHDRIEVPSLHLAAWHDIFLQGSLDNFAAMRARGAEARLVVGPWTHVTFEDPIGELAFGARASRLGAPSHPEGDTNDLQLAWFRRHLTDAPGEPEGEAPVRIFVMGRDEWRDEEGWPLERAREERWFLGAGGSLGREQLRTAMSERTEFVYDPEDPAPTIGGHTVMARSLPSGPRDQRRLERRADVCVFTSEALREELEVTGRVRAVLEVESSAPAADWVVRLCDVHPDGRSFNLCDGIARIPAGADRPRRVEVDLWSTCNVFGPGHRLRVHVTASSFPRWDRNLNTGDQSSSATLIARQVIHHGSEWASWIELPVVPAPPA